MANVFAGYRGIADVDGIGNVRFGDASITATQEVIAPDMIMGDWDHDAYYFGPITVGGSMSGPVTETFASGTGLFGWGAKRTGTCGELSAHDVTLYYYCGTPAIGNTMNYRTFTDMYINSLGFSCAAGDVANFSIEFMGKSAGSWSSGNPPEFQTPEKIITWEKCGISITGGSETSGVDVSGLAFSNFDFTIANNIETVYSLSQTDLFPYELVPGLRTISGTLSVYNTPTFDGHLAWDDYVAAGVSTITFNIGALSVDLKVRFHRVQPASSVSPIISTVGFTGVTHQDSLDA